MGNNILLTNAKIYTMDKLGIIEKGYIRIKGSILHSIGNMCDLKQEDDEAIINLEGACCYPGFIDAHTHLGMWEDGLGFEGDDGNESTDPSTPHLRALDAINPLDRCFEEGLKAGVTSVLTGPGSANPIGGQITAMKTYGRRIDDMVIKSPAALKFAMGENPKTVYHERSQMPITRMATASIIREQFFKAKKYLKQLQDSERDEDLEEPEYDFKCESLLPVIKKEIPAHIHAHRADDIFTAIRVAKEFDINYTIIHCTSGYEISDYLASENITALCGPILCDRSKPELKNLTPKNPGILSKAGVKVAIVTDHPVVPIQYLPLCAGICVREGMDYMQALAAITINPAAICGISNRVGSLAPGKDADIVVFDTDPFSVYAKPQMVICNGIIV